MIQDQYGQIIMNEDDVMDIVMRGTTLKDLRYILVDDTVDLERITRCVQILPEVFTRYYASDELVELFDSRLQSEWQMPESYKHLDIAEYVLSLCENETELQRVGEELLLYQERDLFDLLRYMKYLVDVMTEHRVIWGVGRGSSVASFVLYKLGVHRINSIFYKLEISEFLR